MKTITDELEFQDTETEKLESLVSLAEREKDIFFDTCCVLNIFENFNFKVKKYNRLRLNLLEIISDRLDLFLDFLKRENVHTVKEVLRETTGFKRELNKCQKRLRLKQAMKRSRKRHVKYNLDIQNKKALFDRILIDFSEIYSGIKRAIYVPENKELYSRIEDLVKKVADIKRTPIKGSADKALVTIALYKALAERKPISIVSDDGDLGALLAISYDKFQYCRNLLRQFSAKNKVCIYKPTQKRKGEYVLGIRTTKIKLHTHGSDFYHIFNPLVQRINESLVSVA